METQKPIEEILNNLYVKAWAIVEDLGLARISDDDPINVSLDDFVGAVKRSFEFVKKGNYSDAREDLDRVSARFIELCTYKDIRLPNIDINLSSESAEAYRALPDPELVQQLDPSKLNDNNVRRMIRAYERK